MPSDTRSATSRSHHPRSRSPAGLGFRIGDGYLLVSPHLGLAPLVVCGTLFLDALDTSMGSIALASIGRDLHVALGSLQWIVSGYVLGYGGLLLLDEMTPRDRSSGGRRDRALPHQLLSSVRREVRLSSGPAMDAVLAAASIPGVLPPAHRGGQRLINGGVVNDSPISHAIELGAERIYVLEAYDPVVRGLPASPRGALDVAVHAFTLLIAAVERANLARHAKAVELTVLPAANPKHVQPIDFNYAEELIRHGLTGARRALKNAPPAGADRRRPQVRNA